jgi:hypothetical protein
MEAIYQYAEHNNKTVSDEAVLVINLLTQSDPFYIASLFRSDWEHQDFTSFAALEKDKKSLQGMLNELKGSTDSSKYNY